MLAGSFARGILPTLRALLQRFDWLLSQHVSLYTNTSDPNPNPVGTCIYHVLSGSESGRSDGMLTCVYVIVILTLHDSHHICLKDSDDVEHSNLETVI
jgi:hypothetical protein